MLTRNLLFFHICPGKGRETALNEVTLECIIVRQLRIPIIKVDKERSPSSEFDHCNVDEVEKMFTCRSLGVVRPLASDY